MLMPMKPRGASTSQASAHVSGLYCTKSISMQVWFDGWMTYCRSCINWTSGCEQWKNLLHMFNRSKRKMLHGFVRINFT